MTTFHTHNYLGQFEPAYKCNISMRCDMCFDRLPHYDSELPSSLYQSSHHLPELSIGSTSNSFWAQLCEKHNLHQKKDFSPVSLG